MVCDHEVAQNDHWPEQVCVPEIEEEIYVEYIYQRAGCDAWAVCSTVLTPLA